MLHNSWHVMKNIWDVRGNIINVSIAQYFFLTSIINSEEVITWATNHLRDQVKHRIWNFIENFKNNICIKTHCFCMWIHVFNLFLIIIASVLDLVKVSIRNLSMILKQMKEFSYVEMIDVNMASMNGTSYCDFWAINEN